MSQFSPVIYVDLVHKSGKLFGIRPQRYRWVARNANNFRVMAVSGEAFTNRQDALDSITQLFDAGTTVFLREAEKGNVLLRQGIDTSGGEDVQ